MIRTTIIPNPFSKQGLQKILDTETIAEKNHTHTIQDIQGLSLIFQQPSNTLNLEIKKGYFID